MTALGPLNIILGAVVLAGVIVCLGWIGERIFRRPR